MPVDLDLRRMRFFVEVVRQGGFSSAGKVLFTTQPTVSKAIRQLETGLGVVLLQRVGKRSDGEGSVRIIGCHRVTPLRQAGPTSVPRKHS